MKRREFLKEVGVGSVGLASLSSVLLGSARQAHAGKPEERHSTFIAQSQAPAMGSVVPRAAMEGRVEFRPNKGKVKGGGSWVIFDNAAPVPKPILAGGTLFGTWEAEEFVTFIGSGAPRAGAARAAHHAAGAVRRFSKHACRLACSSAPAPLGGHKPWEEAKCR